MSGVDVDIIRILAEKLHFTFSLTIADGWGTPANPPSLKYWTGIIGSVHNKTAKIGIGHVPFQREWAMAINYVACYNMESYFITTKPEMLSSLWNLSTPFNNSVWLAYVCTLIVACLVFGIVSKYSGHANFVENASKILQLQFKQGTFFTSSNKFTLSDCWEKPVNLLGINRLGCNQL